MHWKKLDNKKIPAFESFEIRVDKTDNEIKAIVISSLTHGTETLRIVPRWETLQLEVPYYETRPWKKISGKLAGVDVETTMSVEGCHHEFANKLDETPEPEITYFDKKYYEDALT